MADNMPFLDHHSVLLAKRRDISHKILENHCVILFFALKIKRYTLVVMTGFTIVIRCNIPLLLYVRER